MYTWFGINTISLLVLAIVLVSHVQNSHESLFRQRYFRGMVFSNMVILVISTATLFVEGRSGSLSIALNLALRSVYLLFCAVFCLTWALFCTMKRGQKIKRYESLLMCLPLLLLLVFLLVNLGGGLLFTISDFNTYERGPFFYAAGGCMYSYVIYAFIVLWRQRKAQFLKEKTPNLLIPFVAAMTGVAQLAVGVDIQIVWPSVALALLVMQIYMLGEKANIDHLTGLYNRKYIDDYVEDLLQASRLGYGARSSRNFAALMLDIDGFKNINDSYGHLEGDHAIATVAALLKKSVRTGDFVSRYGGDEFLVILDHCASGTPKRVIKRISENFERFNSENESPYKLEFSIGFKLFSSSEDLNAEDIFASIDGLMYQNKQSKAADKIGSGQADRFEYNRTQQ